MSSFDLLDDEKKEQYMWEMKHPSSDDAEETDQLDANVSNINKHIPSNLFELTTINNLLKAIEKYPETQINSSLETGTTNHLNAFEKSYNQIGINDEEDTETKDDIPAYKWCIKQHFTTEYVAVTPIFGAHENKIYYTTYYSSYRDSGIYCYDIDADKHKCIKLYKHITSVKYLPKYYASCFSEAQQKIYFIGGDEPYDGLMVYDLRNDTLEKINFDRHIGCNPALIARNNCDVSNKGLVFGFVHMVEYANDILVPVPIIQMIELYSNCAGLHIIGGEENNQHLYWNTNSRKVEVIHTFNEYKTGIRGQALVQNNKTGKMYMLGGCNTNTLHYNDVWSFDSAWIRHSNWQLPAVMCGFGCVLYDARIIVIFGGRTEYSNPLDAIYYLQVSKPDAIWIQANVKCQFRGCCNAVLVQNELVVHIMPFGHYKDHTCLAITKILPASLLNTSHTTT